MSFLRDLFDQANPFDGGKTAGSSRRRGKGQQQRPLLGKGYKPARRMLDPQFEKREPMQYMSPDNRITNRMVNQGRLPQEQYEYMPQDMYQSPDNQITNRMVQQGRLPQSQGEYYPQQPDNVGDYLRRLLGL